MCVANSRTMLRLHPRVSRTGALKLICEAAINTTDYLRLLKSHDDTEYVEYPAGFDYALAESQFAVMAEEIASLFPGSRFETGVEIQDASFHGQIYVALAEQLTLVRVSNFGRFVSFCGGDYDCLPAVARDRLLQVFAAHGYTFIPPEVLDMPCDGVATGVSGFKTWGHRFFEWI